MYIAFVDEADHTSKDSFTTCGLTVIPASKSSKLHAEISDLRDKAGLPETAPLKFSSASRPESCTPAEHEKLKKDCIQAASINGAVFFGYCFFNGAFPQADSDRNRIFGFNTLLKAYNSFLETKEAVGLAVFDRLDLSKKGKMNYNNGFDYLKEKFSVGNTYKETGKTEKLSKILSYSQTAEGLSHFGSVNDILTGGLRYMANGRNDTPRKGIQEDIQLVMNKNSRGEFREAGFFLRPYKRDDLSEPVRAEYEQLRSFLNR